MATWIGSEDFIFDNATAPVVEFDSTTTPRYWIDSEEDKISIDPLVPEEDYRFM